MTTGNRPTRASCAVAALTASVLVLAVSCGGSGHHAPEPRSASRLVGRALGGQAAVRSGRVQLSLTLSEPRARKTFVLQSATRFRMGASGAPASLAITLEMGSENGSSAPPALRLALASGSRGISLSVQGRPVHVGAEAERALQAGYAQLSGEAAGAGGPSVAPFGLNAAEWLQDPRYVTPAGDHSAESVHVRAALALAPFLRDVRRLAGVSAALEAAGSRTGAGSLALALSRAASLDEGAGTVDLYADPRSRLPRSLHATVKLHPDTAGGSLPRASSSPPVSIALAMEFTALGAGPT